MRDKNSPCPHISACPGCPRWNASPPSPEVVTLIKKLREISQYKTPIPIFTRHPLQSRWRAKLAVRGRYNSPKIGLFAAHSHQIVDIPECPLHHPLINRTIQKIKFWIREKKIQPYRENTKRGLLRYLQLVFNRPTETIQLTLVINSERPEIISPHLTSLTRDTELQLHSLWINCNTSEGNYIFGDNWFHYTGPKYAREKILYADLFFHPGAFGQANLLLSEELIASTLQYLTSIDKTFELYAGTGAFGLNTLIYHQNYISFNETSPWGLAGLRRSISLLPHELQKKIEIYPGTAEKYSHLLDKFDAIIADPPRKGLNSEIIKALINAKRIKKIIYISCNLSSLLRDSRALISSKKWAIRDIKLFDLFPYTRHIETLTLFIRK